MASLQHGISNTEHVVNKPDDVPDSKLPKSRQPSSLRDKILGTPLPDYSGPYSVGMMEVEVPAREPRSFSDIKRNDTYLLELDTVLFTVYYPSGFWIWAGSVAGRREEWSRPTWLPRPRIEVAKGYGKFVGMPAWLATT